MARKGNVIYIVLENPSFNDVGASVCEILDNDNTHLLSTERLANPEVLLDLIEYIFLKYGDINSVAVTIKYCFDPKHIRSIIPRYVVSKTSDGKTYTHRLYTNAGVKDIIYPSGVRILNRLYKAFNHSNYSNPGALDIGGIL